MVRNNPERLNFATCYSGHRLLIEDWRLYAEAGWAFRVRRRLAAPPSPARPRPAAKRARGSPFGDHHHRGKLTLRHLGADGWRAAHRGILPDRHALFSGHERPSILQRLKTNSASASGTTTNGPPPVANPIPGSRCLSLPRSVPIRIERRRRGRDSAGADGESSSQRSSTKETSRAANRGRRLPGAGVRLFWFAYRFSATRCHVAGWFAPGCLRNRQSLAQHVIFVDRHVANFMDFQSRFAVGYRSQTLSVMPAASGRAAAE